MNKKDNKKIEKIKKLIDDGEIDKALEIADANIIESLFELGTSSLISGKYNIAEKIFNRIIQINTNNAEAWYCKGLAFANMAKHDEALKCYEQAININPNDDKTWSSKGAVLGKLGKHDESLKCYDEAIKINPNNDKTWYNKGIAFGNLGKNDAAIKCCDQAIKINPYYDKAWYNKGVALGILGKHDEALKCFDNALKINPNHDKAWYNKGIALGKLEKHDEALKCYELAIKINPYYADAWINKGVVLGKLGKYDEEIKCYDQAIKINPNDNLSWNNKGVVLGKLGKYDEEIKCYDEALHINPNYYMASYNKGTTLVNIEKYDEAIKCFDEALKINPNFAEAYGNLGITFLNIHKYDKAITKLRKAKELFSKGALKKDVDKAHKIEMWAINASELMSKLRPLDKQFISSLNSRRLTELKEKSMEIAKGIQGVIKEFEEREMPKDVSELLVSKAICFTCLSDALKFEKVDLDKLAHTKKVFEKWGSKTLIIAVNSLDTFIRELKEYNNLEEIPEEIEKIILIALGNSYVLDGKLTEEITDKIKGEPFPAKPTGIEKKPEITEIKIENTEKDWIRVCLVQLDFTLTQKFPYAIKEEIKRKIRSKIFEALEIAKKEMVDITCFPELSFDKEWADEIKDYYKDGVIICGSYYDNNNRNLCQIFIDGKDYAYAKCHPSIMEEKNGEGMEPCDKIFLFQTKYGKISVLTCVDFDKELNYIINNYIIDFIINPRYDIDTEYAFQKKADIIIDRTDGSRNPVFILQMNPNKTEWGEYKGGGGTTIIGCEHKYRLEKYIKDGLRSSDEIKYKICEAKEEMMLLADLKIGPTTERRTKLCNWYLYNGEHWELLRNKGIWL